MIKVTNLNKFYNKGKSNELHVINETTLTLEDTGLVCILGESGSGKTTLMNTISGLDDFKDGTIDVDGTVITKYGSKKQEQVRNDMFGYIFQNYYLLQDRTVEYNIMLSLSLYDISDDEKEDRIDYVLKAVDMERYKKRLVSQLSGGQQQRIAIARALAKTPKVIFADEPTGNLDEANTMRIMGILKKISQECLVVVVTHEKSIADFFADRILWISDGKIEKEKYLSEHESYVLNDDNNIYLHEFNKSEYQNGAVKVDVYNNEEMPEVSIKLVYENGKIFLYSNDAKNLEILTEKDEKKVIDGPKPKVELEDVELDYNLDPLTTARVPKIGFKRVLHMARTNLKTMGKKKVFLIISLLVMSVLMVLTIQDILNILTVNEQDIIKTDSNYLRIFTQKNGMIDNEQYDASFDKVIEGIEKSGIEAQIYIQPNMFLSYKYSGFWQLENVESDIKDYSLVSLKKLDKSKLIYGKMPEAYGEIVIDKWVLDSFINQENEISNVITSVQHFIGKEVIVSKEGMALKIVGISDTNEPSVYIDELTGLGVSTWSEPVASLDMLKNVYKEEFKDITLQTDEALVSESTYELIKDEYFKEKSRNLYNYHKKTLERAARGEEPDLEELERIERRINITYEEFLFEMENADDILFTYETALGIKYNVAGTFPDEFEANYVVKEGSYELLLEKAITKLKRFNIYTSDKEAMTDFLKNSLDNETLENVNITIVDDYTKALTEFKNSRNERISQRLIITLTIFAVSMIILYFMMRANAIQRMTDLGVYRLLGISKTSIIGLFAIETILITTYTSLVGVTLTAIITKFIGSVPSLGMSVIFPWYAFVLTLVFIYTINILIGITPIRKLLKLPPAQLASKYDI